MTSLLVKDGLLVNEHLVRPANVLIRDGRVAEILEPDRQAHADEVLDASGLHVLPGLVDAHVHFNEPGRTDWEGFVSGTSAAAAGGVTTVCDMPLNSHPPTVDARALALKRAAVADHALVDYAFWGGVIPRSVDHLAELRDHGVVGVKAFLCDSGLVEYPPLDDFALLEAMERCAELGLLLALHAEDPAPLSGPAGPLDWARSRPPESELRAVERALELAGETSARVHFVHISTPQAVRAIRAARGTHADVSCETCPHYLALDEHDLERLGVVAKCAPPLRSRDLVDELCQLLLDGSVDFVASDHSPCPPSMKLEAPDFSSAWGGMNGVQTLLPVLLTLGVPLPRLVHLASANPARRMGLFPRKGALEPGSDADLTLLDAETEWTVAEEDLLTRWKLSPFVGRTVRGKVVATVVRGTPVFRNGQLLARPGFGVAL